MYQSIGVNINKDLKNVLRAKKMPFRKSFIGTPHLEVEFFKGRNKKTSQNTMDNLYDMMKSKKDSMDNLYDTMKSKKDSMMNNMKKMYNKGSSMNEDIMEKAPKLSMKKNNAALFAIGTLASAVVVSSLISKSHSHGHKHRHRF